MFSIFEINLLTIFKIAFKCHSSINLYCFTISMLHTILFPGYLVGAIVSYVSSPAVDKFTTLVLALADASLLGDATGDAILDLVFVELAISRVIGENNVASLKSEDLIFN